MAYPVHYVADKGRLYLFVGRSPSDSHYARFNTVLDDEGNSIFARRVLDDMNAALIRKAEAAPAHADKTGTASGHGAPGSRRPRKTGRRRNRPRPN
ncbi:hypothetical protein pneo_cds_953 [Pandoravirus neocaledonia]|uniref:Uncharacterized protein n=1 Tax=Pandoravirus neocaledonia TaxID=2107708 RepID=A0A2U7UE12_9VIRU|nr:hypothetical protein pneo_cds_953 [Pandoravirus neocaledonia]AVK76560.1 hypothetical protein pneo_cds_953 [Pandoravirus neocaledonia]